MARNFRELQAKMSPASQVRSQEKARKMMAEMSLNELRAARAITQEHLASILGVRQAAVSKMEKRADMYVSTLRHFVRAMGGELEIRAVFPDAGAVRIAQFSDIAEPHEKR
jgi:DNA-binding XRE family transcriptional regulator